MAYEVAPDEEEEETESNFQETNHTSASCGDNSHQVVDINTTDAADPVKMTGPRDTDDGSSLAPGAGGTDSEGSGQFCQFVTPALGNTWTHLVNTRLILQYTSHTGTRQVCGTVNQQF